MSERPEVIPPRVTQQREDEGLERAELYIRVMERFLDATSARPETEAAYPHLLSVYMDVLQAELAPYAFDLAYALFSRDPASVRMRRELDHEPKS